MMKEPYKLNISNLEAIIKEEIHKTLQGYREPKILLKDPEGNIIDYTQLSYAKEHKAKKEQEDAIKGFQSYYRQLTPNQRFSLVEWLKTNLLSELNLKQIENIVSRVIASSDGLSARKNPLQKPK